VRRKRGRVGEREEEEERGEGGRGEKWKTSIEIFAVTFLVLAKYC
jgi:hypothetical protein